MSKKNANKKMLDNLEFEFDEIMVKLREADEAGKFPQKLKVEAKALHQLIKGQADKILDRKKAPLRW